MISQIVPFLTLAREARAIWEDMEGGDRDKVDALVRKAVSMAPLPEPLEVVRSYLRDSAEPLPVRLMGAALHPATRMAFSNLSYTPDSAVDNDVNLLKLMG